MSNRHAVLIGNSVAYQDSSKGVPKQVVADSIAELAQRLSDLEDEFAFTTTQIVDRTHSVARRDILRALRAASQRNKDTVLIYYFGHGLKPPDRDELFLFFKDSDAADETTMLNFEVVSDWLRTFRIRNTVMILDCCYAGTVQRQIQPLERYNGNYFVMAAVTPKEKALLDHDQQRPIGVFSNAILNSFDNPQVRSVGRDVSLASFFGYVASRVKSQSAQEPYSIDRNFAAEILYRQTTKPIIPEALRQSAPKKSSYNKIFVIASTILAHEFKDVDSLYNYAARRHFEEFLQPCKTGPNTVEYVFVGRGTFGSYVSLCRLLGIVEAELPLRLTPEGKRMLRNNGAHFNSGLHSRLDRVWKGYGFSFPDLEDVISIRTHNSNIPSGDGIYRDFVLRRRVPFPKAQFKVLLDLSGFVGAFKYSAEKTFFPAISSVGED
jgi:hypothetical protein